MPWEVTRCRRAGPLGALALPLVAVVSSGCAFGGSVHPRDGGVAQGRDAGIRHPRPDAALERRDAGRGMDASVSPCGTSCGPGQVCQNGTCVSQTGCSAPGACSPGATQNGAPCGNCGVLQQTCGSDCTWGAFSCTGEGVCAMGDTQNDSQACTGSCGGTQTRTRTCDSTCHWGSYSSWSSCPTSCATCGDGTCNGSETCASCSDCQAGQLGTGSGGDSCAGVPAGQWRCVTDPGLGGRVSQVCRSGSWINFNFAPQDCAGCVCSFSTACCQAGSTSTGC